MTAVCDDRDCHYKIAPPDQCRGDGAPLQAYQCRAPALSAMAAKQAVCSAQRSVPWPAAGKGYSITAVIEGPTCASASGTVTVRRPDGLPIWSQSVAARGSVEFQHLQSPKDLDAVLTSLLRTPDGTSGDLPEWADGARFPPRGWYADGQVTRERWNSWRAAKLPVLHFTWGIETDHVYVLDEDGVLREVGGHTPI
jgi:hypothetical protein